MSEYIWETFDSLFKTVNRQDRKVEELEGRIAVLEERLKEQAETANRRPRTEARTEMPAERAA
jgi:peptidoglycan hydrolase CwlO-like protein